MTLLAERLVKLRDKQNVSQDALRTRGVNQQTISRWERGLAPQSVNSLVAIANYYQVSTDYLLGLTDDATPTGQASEIQKLYDCLSIDRQRDLLVLAETWLEAESAQFRMERFLQMLAEYGEQPGVLQQMRAVMDELLAEDGEEVGDED